MGKVIGLGLSLFVTLGILGTALSVCQGLMAETCHPEPSVRCSPQDDFCQKMCRLGQEQRPGVLQKKAPEAPVSLCPLLLYAQPVPNSLPLPAFESASRFELALLLENAGEDLHLQNAPLLI